MARAKKKSDYVPQVGEKVIVPLDSGKCIGTVTELEGSRIARVDVTGVIHTFFWDDLLPHTAENFHLPEGR